MGRPLGPRIVITCEVCGKTQERRPSAVSRRKTNRFFCSIGCRRKASLRPFSGEHRPCKQCGTAVYVPKSGLSGNTFCSRACYGAYQPRRAIRFTCPVCGKDYRLSLSQVRLRGKTYCSTACRATATTKRRAPRPAGQVWSQGGDGLRRTVNPHGYVEVWKPDHPGAVKGRALEHRVVMEAHLGRLLLREEHVHHRDGDRTNNALENLQVVSPSDHHKIEWAGRRAIATQVKELKAELAEYKRRFGPLKKES